MKFIRHFVNAKMKRVFPIVNQCRMLNVFGLAACIEWNNNNCNNNNNTKWIESVYKSVIGGNRNIVHITTAIRQQPQSSIFVVIS